MALPPNSPRLPSPPPAAEIQIGPKSPASSGATLAQQQIEQQIEQTIIDANAKRRIHPGTRACDFAAGPPLVPLNELDSAFQLQEHLAALHYFHTASNTTAISRDTALILAQAPIGTDRTLWLYELCRFLISQCNSLIVGFLFDTPPCSAATCPEMRASEWQFLCAVHEQPRSCCAIDYCCHTLDWAANVVTNPKIFPSRFVFADQHDKSAAVKNLINVFRRLHRIFAHAWFQHRGVFWSVEGQTGLYVFFKTVCDMYDLLPAENYKLPPEAEGLDTASSLQSASGAASGNDGAAVAAPAAAPANSGSSAPPTENTPGLIPMASITDKNSLGYGSGAPGNTLSSSHRSGPGPNTVSGGGGSGLGSDLLGGDSEHLNNSVGRTNTRRHIRSSPSTGSAVTTVLEQDEDSASAAAGAASSLAPLQPVSILRNNDAQTETAPPPAIQQETEAEVEEGTGDAETEVPVTVQQDWTPVSAPAHEDVDAAKSLEEAPGGTVQEPELATTESKTAEAADEEKTEEPVCNSAPTEAVAASDDEPAEAGASVSVSETPAADAEAKPAEAAVEAEGDAEDGGKAEAEAPAVAEETEDKDEEEKEAPANTAAPETAGTDDQKPASSTEANELASQSTTDDQADTTAKGPEDDTSDAEAETANKD